MGRGDNDRLVFFDNNARLANNADAAGLVKSSIVHVGLVELVEHVEFGSLQLGRYHWRRWLCLLDNDRIGHALWRCLIISDLNT